MTNSELSDSIFHTISMLLPDIKKRYFVESLGVFGSYARREASEESDLDLLVEFNKPISWEYFELQSYLEERLNKKVDLVTKRALKDPLKKQILDEVIPIG